jgi:hypothetical protein
MTLGITSGRGSGRDQSGGERLEGIAKNSSCPHATTNGPGAACDARARSSYDKRVRLDHLSAVMSSEM